MLCYLITMIENEIREEGKMEKQNEVAVYNENCVLAGEVNHEATAALYDEDERERGDVTWLDAETAREWASAAPTNANRWMRKAGRAALTYLD